ncbi:MAG: hypothetical protein AB7I04_04365 [Pseudomonadales bacterium]
MEKLLLLAEGSAFEDSSFDLRALESTLTNYRQLIDHTLPISLGHRSLTPRTKREIEYSAKIENGSLRVVLEFLVEHPEVLTLLAVDGGNQLAAVVAKLVRDAVVLRRAVTKILDMGNQPKIQADANADQSIKAEINNSTVTINNPQIIMVANSTRPAVDRMIRSLDGDQIRKLKISERDTEVELTPDDLPLTTVRKEELDRSINLLGRLDMVSFSAHRGNIVSSGTRYPVFWEERLRGKIREFADRDDVMFVVKPVIDARRFDREPVGLHVLDCYVPQDDLDLS